VQLGPDPAARGAPTADGIEHNENRTDGGDDTQKAEDDDPGRERVESGDAVGERDGDNPTDAHREEQEADQAGQEALAAFVRIQFQRAAVMLANHRTYGPEKNRQENDGQTEDEEAIIEDSVFEKADALENEEGVVHLELPVARRIFLEPYEILAMDFAVEEGLNLLKFFGFPTGRFQRIDADSAISIRRDFGFADEGEQVNE